MYNYVNIKRIPHCRNSASPCMTAKKLEQRSKGVWCQKTPCACRPQSSPSLSLCCSFTVLNVTNPLYDHLLQNRCCYKTKQNKTKHVSPCATNPESTSGIGAVMFWGFFFVVVDCFFFTGQKNVPFYVLHPLGIHIENVRKGADVYIYLKKKNALKE